ncbi:MAG TPA: hypothetical protein VFB60_22015 [Ktedonobacteraceae bacterium]|nr:hypothetical protein [Ktedonobacteraceae bacterium]
MSKEQIIQKLVETFEQLITVATEAERCGATSQENRWGPREIERRLRKESTDMTFWLSMLM